MEAVQAVECTELAVGKSDISNVRRALLESATASGLRVDSSSPSMLRISRNDAELSAEVVVILGVGKQRVQVSRFEYTGADESAEIFNLVLRQEVLRDSEVLECDGESGVTAPVLSREVRRD
jgi:hypothetical protein